MNTPLTEFQIESNVLENKNHPHTDWVPASFARDLEVLIVQMGETLKECCYDREDVPEAHNGHVAGEFSFGDLRQMLFSLKSHEAILKKYQP